MSAHDDSTGNTHGLDHVPEHVKEFGELEDVVHVAARTSSEAGDEVPVPPVTRRGDGGAGKRERRKRLARRLVKTRHLMQHFEDTTLYRSAENRRVYSEELFLDIVIVGAIAAIGHELRDNFHGWLEVEKFLLLFSAVYSSWRALVSLWNLWGVKNDVIDKLGIWAVFTSLTGIGLGAHGAFDETRSYVAVCSFLATFIPSASGIWWSIREPLLKNKANIINQAAFNSIFTIISVLPYLAAAFVNSPSAARKLYWVPMIIQINLSFLLMFIYRFIHRNRTGTTRVAVAIELMIEKYEVLSLIVLGESMLALLFEASTLVTKEGANVRGMYLAAAASTAILYSIQTLYVNVDAPIARGGIHAIRHSSIKGIAWATLHLPYHMFLILFATGIGILLRDIALPPAEVVRAVVLDPVSRAAQGSIEGLKPDGIAQFSVRVRVLFSVGWAGAVVTSALIGALHFPGPRGATKHHRSTVRSVVAVGLAVGMPFARIQASLFLLVFFLVSVTMAFVEFVMVQCDFLGWFRSERSLYPSTTTTGGNKVFEYTSYTESSSEMDEADDTEQARPPNGLRTSIDLYTEAPLERCAAAAAALRARCHRGHRHRLVAVLPHQRRYKECGQSYH